MNNKKLYLLVAIGVLVLLMATGTIYYFYYYRQKTEEIGVLDQKALDAIGNPEKKYYVE
ncbi:hypothetical protein HY227_02230, partial [Candidatus Wolfebacteria bacterium]|nr:hypothetical protein [Candidatus Wolfebacteria bacterium]